MELAPGVHRLENVNGSNVVLLADEQMAVVDTGIAGNGEAIVEEIRKLGRSPSDLRWIIVTHFHFDHSGSAAELHELTGARIVAHSAETLAGEDGTLQLRKGNEGESPPSWYRWALRLTGSGGRQAAQTSGTGRNPRHASTRDAGARRRGALHGRAQDPPRAGTHTRQHLPDTHLAQGALPRRLRSQQHRPAQPASHVGQIEAQGARRIAPLAAGAGRRLGMLRTRPAAHGGCDDQRARPDGPPVRPADVENRPQELGYAEAVACKDSTPRPLGGQAASQS